MKRIILPTDFSENAGNAVRYAIQLFMGEECTFYLLHTYTPAIYRAEYLLHSPGQIGLGDVHLVSAMEDLEQLQQQLEKEFNNPKHHFIRHAAFNTLIDEIVETVDREKIDLVIMGTQGATGAKEILFGTNTVHLIDRANCPVIAVPSDFVYKPPKEILFPTDYEIAYGEDRLKILLHLAKMHASRVEVIHISSGYELSEARSKNKQSLGSILGKIPHGFHDLPDQGVIEGINNFRSGKRMDLLAMIKNKHTFLERLFIDPVIKKTAFHLNIPFLVFPAQT